MANVRLLTFHHVMSQRMIIKQPFEKQTSLLGFERFATKECLKMTSPEFCGVSPWKYVILTWYKLVALPVGQNAVKWRYFKSRKHILCMTEDCDGDCVRGQILKMRPDDSLEERPVDSRKKETKPKSSNVRKRPLLMYILSWELYLYRVIEEDTKPLKGLFPALFFSS